MDGEGLRDGAGEEGMLEDGFIGLLVFARRAMARCFLNKKPEPTGGRANKDGNCVALSFAGIIQIRYEGYLSPGSELPGPLARRECSTARLFVMRLSMDML
jgi:hypothetical protein